MIIHDFVGELVDEPIKSNAVGDIRTLWDKPQNQRVRGQVLRSASGKTMGYTLLYFIPGLTTYCGLHGIPILTGYMSGCYLFRYRRHGHLRVAHVGTHDTLTAWSDKAKAAWKSIANSAQTSDILGFDPLRDVSTRLLMEGQKVGNPQVAGYWEGNGSARILVFGNPPGQGLKKILVGVESAPLRPWSSIQHDPKMQ